MITIGTKIEALKCGDEIFLPGQGVHHIKNIYLNPPFINVEIVREGNSHKTWFYASDTVHKVIG